MKGQLIQQTSKSSVTFVVLKMLQMNAFAHAMLKDSLVVLVVKPFTINCIKDMSKRIAAINATIKKFAELRSLEYKSCKILYQQKSGNEKQQILNEMEEYIEKVESGEITPSKPLIPSQA